MIIRMNPTIKSKWIKALRSGKYKQGKGALRPTTNTYCCLGVLTDLYTKETKTEWTKLRACKHYALADYTELLPFNVQKWAGLDNDSGMYDLSSLSEDNDGNENTKPKSFTQIANIIAKNF